MTNTQISTKTAMIDVVVVDIQFYFGMFLSHSWEANLGGMLQMDMTYSSIPVFGEQRRL